VKSRKTTGEFYVLLLTLGTSSRSVTLERYDMSFRRQCLWKLLFCARWSCRKC